MKLLKILGIVIVGLITILLIVAAILPSQIHVSRSVQINAKPETVYKYVADFNNFIKWNPWSQKDPSAEHIIDGTPQALGHFWSWRGEDVGEGSLTIEKLDPGKRIDSKLVFASPMQGEAKDIWIFSENDNATNAEWIYEGTLKYPLERFFGLLMDGMIGNEFETGLGNLKKMIESGSKNNNGL